MPETKGPSNAYEAAEYVTKALDLPEGFVIRLLAEDDWSFVIKAHALTETSVFRAIEFALPQCRIHKFLRNLSHRRRVDLARQLEAIDPATLRGISELADIRNDIVHDITKSTFTFEQYLQDENAKRRFEAAFFRNTTEIIDIDGTRMQREDFLRESPKWAIMEFLLECLVNVYLQEMKGMIDMTSLKIGTKVLRALGSLRRRDSRS